MIGVPFYVMDFLEGPIVTGELPARARDARRPGARLGLDLVDTLVEIHDVDVRSPGVADFVREGSYLERQVRRFTQLWEVNRTRELPAVVEVGGVARGEPARAGAARRRPRRLPARQHDPGRGPADPNPRRARLGDGRGRRSRAPTSATCWPPTASRAARRTRSAPRPSLRPRAFRPGGSWSSATSSGAAATSSRSRGSRRSRCGRRRSSARRSTAASSAESWPRRTRAPPASSRACRSSPRPRWR